MEYIKILGNKNRISNTAPGLKSYVETAENFTMRFVFSGHETYTIGSRQLSAHNDSFIILNKGTRFTSNIDPWPPLSVFSIEFDEEFLSDFSRKYLVKNKNLPDELNNPDPQVIRLRETIYPFKGAMRTVVNRLKELLESGTEDWPAINKCLDQCLLAYYKVYNEEIFQKAVKLNFLHYNTRIEIVRRLNLAREYLYANYNRNVNLDRLADHSCLSVNHLLRTFKLAYNQSPHQFLIQLRLQRAQLLLTKTEYPVYEIVNMVGFKCTSSFIRLFRTRYKTTPLKYRSVLAA